MNKKEFYKSLNEYMKFVVENSTYWGDDEDDETDINFFETIKIIEKKIKCSIKERTFYHDCVEIGGRSKEDPKNIFVEIFVDFNFKMKHLLTSNRSSVFLIKKNEFNSVWSYEEIIARLKYIKFPFRKFKTYSKYDLYLMILFGLVEYPGLKIPNPDYPNNQDYCKLLNQTTITSSIVNILDDLQNHLDLNRFETIKYTRNIVFRAFAKEMFIPNIFPKDNSFDYVVSKYNKLTGRNCTSVDVNDLYDYFIKQVQKKNIPYPDYSKYSFQKYWDLI